MRIARAATVALLLLICPASASAAVNVTGFTVTPSTTQAGAHPDLKISTAFTADPASDDTKDLTVRFPPGLVGNPNAVPKCTTAQFAADTCPANTAVGTVSVTADANLVLVINQTVTSPGTVYNLPAVGAEPARLGIKVRPAPVGPLTFQPISLVSVAKLGPDTGYALETTIPNQPRTGVQLGRRRAPQHPPGRPLAARPAGRDAVPDQPQPVRAAHVLGRRLRPPAPSLSTTSRCGGR